MAILVFLGRPRKSQLKTYNLFLITTVTGTLIVHHFPLALLSCSLLLPVVYLAERINENKLSPVWFILLLVWLEIQYIVFFAEIVPDLWKIREKVVEFEEDFTYVGSSVYPVICCLFLPNLLIVTRTLLPF